MTTPAASKPYGSQVGRWRFPFAVESADVAAFPSFWHRAIVLLIGLAVCVAYLVAQPEIGTSLFSTVWTATFGTTLGVTQLLQLATPLVLAGCAAAVAQRVGLWNIGIEGQLLMGAWAATGVAFALPTLTPVLLLTLMCIAGLLGGALWILLPALLRAYLRVSEIFTTLFLNFVAFLWFVYMISNHWGDKSFQGGGLSSRPLPEEARLPHLVVGSVAIGVGFLVVIVATLILWAFFKYSPYGYKSTLVGSNPKTAAYAGINVRRLTVSVLLCSGAIGGLVGVVVELDHVHRYSTALSNNTGYIAIVVAVLAGNSLLGVIGTGILMAFVVACGSSLQISGLSGDILLLLTGLLLLFGAMANVIARYRLVRRSPRVAGRAISSENSE